MTTLNQSANDSDPFAEANRIKSIAVPEHGFVLWWHPRSMCTSLKAWALRLCGYEVVQPPGSNWMVKDETVHIAVHRLLQYDPSQHGDLLHFSVVKHPLSRLASHFSQQTRDQTDQRLYLDYRKPPLGRWPGGTFRRYVDLLVNVPQEFVDNHVQRQSYMLPDEVFIVRSERLKEEWPPLMRRLGMLEELPPRYNVTPTTDHAECCADWTIQELFEREARPKWRHFYDRELLEKAALHYQEDMVRFGYGL